MKTQSRLVTLALITSLATFSTGLTGCTPETKSDEATTNAKKEYFENKQIYLNIGVYDRIIDDGKVFTTINFKFDPKSETHMIVERKDTIDMFFDASEGMVDTVRFQGVANDGRIDAYARIVKGKVIDVRVNDDKSKLMEQQSTYNGILRLMQDLQTREYKEMMRKTRQDKHGIET